MESAIHIQSAIDRSKIRLQRLKFVDNVEVVKTRVPDSSDQIDITFKITERKAGEFRVSAGWSDTDGAVFDIDLKQKYQTFFRFLDPSISLTKLSTLASSFP